MSDDHDTPRVTSPTQLGTVGYDDSAEFWKAAFCAVAPLTHLTAEDCGRFASDALAEYRARFPVERNPHDFTGASYAAD